MKASEIVPAPKAAGIIAANLRIDVSHRTVHNETSFMISFPVTTPHPPARLNRFPKGIAVRGILTLVFIYRGFRL